MKKNHMKPECDQVCIQVPVLTCTPPKKRTQNSISQGEPKVSKIAHIRKDVQISVIVVTLGNCRDKRTSRVTRQEDK